MSSEARAVVARLRQNTILDRFDEFLNGEGLDVCDFLFLLGGAWRDEAARIDHPDSKAALESAADGVSHAGMDFYVSTK